MIAHDTLRAAWRSERAHRLARYRPLPALDESGLVLGPMTVVARRVADRWGAADLALDDAGSRALAVLAVAYWRPVSPAAIGHLRRAAKAMARGDRALAAIHVAHGGLEKIAADETTAFRLFAAERLLDAGVAPRELMTGLGLDPWPLDALVKFDSDQPRDGHGRWTDGGNNGKFGGDPPISEKPTPVSSFTSFTPAPFVDNRGNAILDAHGRPMSRPSDVNPSLFVDLGRAAASDPSGAMPYAGLTAFGRGGPLDVQRVGPDQAFVGGYTDFANVAIGLYASAANIPEVVTMNIANWVGGNSVFAQDAVRDSTYSNLRVENVYDIQLGYRLYQSGRISPSQPE